MRNVCRLAALLLLTALVLPTGAEPPPEDDPDAALDARLEALARDAAFPGFAVAVVDRERTLYARGFGLADRENEVPFSADTVLNIGSVSKTFIGVALMQAVADGQIDLDAAVDTYLPYKVRNPRFPKSPITLRHLATHTSGIVDREAIYDRAYSRGEVPEMALGDYLQRYLAPGGEWYRARNFGKHAPGAFYEYSNIAAALAAHVLERVTGEGFDELTTRRILEPLSMTDSGWSYAAAGDRHARLYDGAETVEPYTLVTYPDGGLRTSAASLARYLTAIVAGGRLGEVRILDQESTAAMLSPQYTASGARPRNRGPDDSDSGIFWALRANGLVGHTGGDPGISTFMFFDPETGFGRIFLTNTEMTRARADDFKAIWDALKEAYAF